MGMFLIKKSRLMLLLIYFSHWKGRGNGVCCFRNTIFHTVCSECIRHSLVNLLS